MWGITRMQKRNIILVIIEMHFTNVRTTNVWTMYFFGCVHAIISNVFMFRQTNHHREWCIWYTCVIVLPPYPTHTFLQKKQKSSKLIFLILYCSNCNTDLNTTHHIIVMIFRVQCHATVFLVDHVIPKLWINDYYIYSSRNYLFFEKLIYMYRNNSFIELPGFPILIHQLNLRHIDAIVRWF